MTAPDVARLTMSNGLHIEANRQHHRRDGRPKLRFPDPASAMVAVRQLIEQDGDHARRTAAYQCASCGDWHIGNHHPDATLMVEIGERAWSNMRAENRRGVEPGTVYARAYVTLIRRMRRLVVSDLTTVDGSTIM